MSSISVVIPTRGRQHFLRQAIASVLAQTHARKEIIVVDDGDGAAEARGPHAPLIPCSTIANAAPCPRATWALPRPRAM